MGVSGVDAGTAAPPARPWHRPPWWLVVVGIALLVAVAVLVGRWTSGDGGAVPASSTLDAPTATAIDDAVSEALTAQSQSVAAVFERIQPSVVEIDVVHDTTVTTTGGQDRSGLGTGVIVNQDGSILTANHVVEHTTAVSVVYSDGTRANAEVVASDPAQDIALLRPDTLPSVVVPAVLGGAGVGVGLPVVAVGNPLGLDDSTTAGVISALGRTIQGDDGTEHGGLIQFDAAVNPGSSGGPLLNQRGEVIGVVVALADPTEDGYFIGIGFAVPIGTAIGTAGGGDEPPK